MKLPRQENKFCACSVVETLEDLANEAQNQRYVSTEVLAEVQEGVKSMSWKSNSSPSVNCELHEGKDCL